MSQWKKKENGELFVDASGNPVRVMEGTGEERAVDYEAITTKLQEASVGEEKYRKQLRAMEAKFACLADVEDPKAFMTEATALKEENERLKKTQNADTTAAVEAATKELKAQHETAYAAALARAEGSEKSLSELKSEVAENKIRTMFNDSKFIKEKCLPNSARPMFDILGRQCAFDEDGQFVGRDAKGEIIRGADGRPAAFDEWAYKAALEYPTGDTLFLAGNPHGNHPGGNPCGNHRPPGVNPWNPDKNTWNVTEQMRLFKENKDLARSMAKEFGHNLPTE